jgi:hypothetical protein
MTVAFDLLSISPQHTDLTTARFTSENIGRESFQKEASSLVLDGLVQRIWKRAVSRRIGPRVA